MDTQDEWVTLGVAAKRLGVHANTLRRWAEDGQVPYMLTPGGHRRFAVRDLDALMVARLHTPTSPGTGVAWAETALVQTRSALPGEENAAWLAAFDPAQRLEQRALGRRLMGLIMQYVNEDRNRTAILDEARLIGDVYGANAAAMGMPVGVAISAALFFRNMLLESAFDLPDSVILQPGEQRRLLGRLNEILNEVELAIAAAYE